MHDMYACRGCLVSSLFPPTSPTHLVSLSPNIKSTPSAIAALGLHYSTARSRQLIPLQRAAVGNAALRCNKDTGIKAMTHSLTAYCVPPSLRHQRLMSL